LCDLLVVIAAALPGIDSHSEPGYTGSDQDPFRIPATVSATRQHLSLTESPSSVTIIDHDLISRLPVFNIAEILKMAPGLQVFRANAAVYGVTQHGQSNRYPRRLEIRVDGRTVYTPINSSVSWESLGLTPDDIALVEVVRGSNIPAYGANAAQGAINIVTRNPVSVAGTETRVTVGDWQTRNIGFRKSLALGTDSALLRGGYKENTGFAGLDDQSQIAHVALQGTHTPTLSDTLDWEVGYSDGNFGYGDGDRPEDFADEVVQNGWLHTRWTRNLGSQQLSLRASGEAASYDLSRTTTLSDYADLTPAELFQRYGVGDRLLEDEAGKRTFQRIDLEFEHGLLPNRNHQLLWGIGYRLTRIRAPDEFQRDDYLDDNTFFIFANEQWRPAPRWGINYGFLSEHHEGRGARLSQRLSVNYHIDENHHLRVSGSNAFRPPTLYERAFAETLTINGEVVDYTYITRPDLKPEEFTTYELGYLGYWFNGDLSVDYRLFVEYLDNGIDYTRKPLDDLDGKYRVLQNDLHWKMRGYDIGIQWRPTGHWLMRLQHANVRAAAFLMTREYDHPYDERTPEHTTSLLVSRDFANNLTASLTGYHESYIDWRQGTEIEPWTRYDIKLEKRWGGPNSRLSLSLVVQNLTGEEYLEYQNRNFFPRLVFISVAAVWP
jgi:iron complex outermembrane receptor protein